MSSPFSLLVLIPTYNSGKQLMRTVAAARAMHPHLLIVSDGSTDGSFESAQHAYAECEGVSFLKLDRNGGKGHAVLHGLRFADKANHTHALVLDADGQHPCTEIPRFRNAAQLYPECMILGVPVFAEDAPRERVHGRRLGNWFTGLVTLWSGIEDSLFGFRIYPVTPTLRIMESIRTARRFDFDTEIAVRLLWSGIRPVNLHAPVIYPPRAEGGISHFRYIRDNLLLVQTHTRLFFGMLVRFRRLLKQRELWRKNPLDVIAAEKGKGIAT